MTGRHEAAGAFDTRLSGLARRTTSPLLRRALHDGLTVAGMVFAAYYWWLLTTGAGQPVDAAWYWHADPAHLYPNPELGEANGYNYSPAFEFVMAPLRLLDFPVFVAAWRAALLALLAWMAGPLTLPLLLTVPVASEVNAGNIQILLGAAIVVGFRHPAAWALVLLTKVTPGIGLLWFALRREWRHLAVAGAVTGALAAVSVMWMPGAWAGWLQLLSQPAPAPSPYYWSFWSRLPLALGVIAIGAWRGWRWTVPVAATLALPVFYIISPSLLVAAIPLARQDLNDRRARTAQARLNARPSSPS